MSDFDGRQLAIGVARGVRSFDVDEFGRLKGVQFADVWRPGENIARCGLTVVEDGWELDAEFSHGYGRPVYVNKKTGERTPVPPMRPAKPESHSLTDCRHGFYAYFDGSNDYRSDARISAVVEGYGEVLIGSRGFRAGKARIVALCIPGAAPEAKPKPEKLRWRDRAWFAITVKSCAAGGGIGWATNGVLNAVNGIPLWVAIPWTGIGVACAVGAWLIPVKFRPKDRDRIEVRLTGLYASAPPLTDAVVAKIRRNYPDLPVFGDFKEMVAAFPPDKGLEPSPETDPRFWEANA